MQEIECTAYKPFSKGSLVAFVNIYIPKWGIELFDLQLCVRENRRWINLPSRSFEENGKRKYIPYLKFKDPKHLDIFIHKVLESIEKFQSQNP